MRPASPTDATALALTALASTLSDERKAQRFLELSGVSPDEMRARAADPDLLAAFLTFLEAHEPDLVAVAADIGCSPEELVQARRTLEDEQ